MRLGVDLWLFFKVFTPLARQDKDNISWTHKPHSNNKLDKWQSVGKHLYVSHHSRKTVEPWVFLSCWFAQRHICWTALTTGPNLPIEKRNRTQKTQMYLVLTLHLNIRSILADTGNRIHNMCVYIRRSNTNYSFLFVSMLKRMRKLRGQTKPVKEKKLHIYTKTV